MPVEMRIGDSAALQLAGEEPHALEHPFDAEKVALGVLCRAAREKLPLAAADFYLKRAGKVELDGFARILYVDYRVVHLQTRNNT